MKLKKSLLICSGTVLAVFVLAFTFIRIIPFKKLKTFINHEYSQAFYDRDKNLIHVSSLEEGKRREFCKLEDFPEDLIKAVLTAEDSRFYKHNGVDLMAVFRAFGQNVSNKRRVSGASTITMQLARMVSPSKKRNFPAKIKDSYNAYRIESRLSKKKILELYLNNIPFGNNIEGFTTAARFFFNKELDELSVEEMYCLAVIPRRPVLYNPLANPENCGEAACRVFNEAEGGDVEVRKFLETAKNSVKKEWEFNFPHLIQEVKKTNNENKVYLTVDSELQKFAEFELRKSLADTEKNRIDNGALIVIKNSTGEVLSWVGSNDWFSSEGGQIDGVRVQNQMGSSMKPFLYAFAFDKNILKPSEVLPDVPMEFGGKNVYMPLNFNNRFNGPVRTRVALASSLNVPAVYILSKVGVDEYLECLLGLGFESLRYDGKKAELGLALGAGEVTLEELTAAFSVFPRDGKYIKPVYISDEVEDNLHKFREIFSSESARIICDMLNDKTARVSGFGYTQTYQTTYPSMFKTGTANQYQNIVALGATKEYTVGVWMGNFSGNTIMGKTGSSLPAYVARKILDFLTDGISEEFEKPVSYSRQRVCSLSGMKAGSNCANSVYEYIKNEDIKSGVFKTCNWHVKKMNGKVSVVFPAEYQKWFNEDNRYGTVNYSSSPLEIFSPKDGSLFYLRGEDGSVVQKIPVEVIGGLDNLQTELSVFYDGKYFTVNRPFRFELPVEKGKHILKVMLGKEVQQIEFSVE